MATIITGYLGLGNIDGSNTFTELSGYTRAAFSVDDVYGNLSQTTVAIGVIPTSFNGLAVYDAPTGGNLLMFATVGPNTVSTNQFVVASQAISVKLALLSGGNNSGNLIGNMKYTGNVFHVFAGTTVALVAGVLTHGTGSSSGSVAISNFPALQGVVGSVAVTSMPPITGTVTVANTSASQTVTGTVAVSALPAISGAVSVSNFPASQAVAGTVAISNFAATQAVSEASLRGALNTAAVLSAGTAFNIVGADTTTTITISATGASAVIDCSGFNILCIQSNLQSSTFCSIQFSNDQTFWSSVSNIVSPFNDSLTSSITGTAASLVKVSGRYVRFNCTGYAAGTNTIIVHLKTEASTETAFCYGVATNIGGATKYKVSSAATTNAALIASGTRSLYSFALYNTTATVCYLHLYDMATAPTVGTSVPVFTIQIPANGSTVMNYSYPLAFTTGLAMSITGLYSDTDTTAVALGSCVGSIGYK